MADIGGGHPISFSFKLHWLPSEALLPESSMSGWGFVARELEWWVELCYQRANHCGWGSVDIALSWWVGLCYQRATMMGGALLPGSYSGGWSFATRVGQVSVCWGVLDIMYMWWEVTVCTPGGRVRY